MTPENKITCRLPTILLFLESEYQIQENHDNIIHIAIAIFQTMQYLINFNCCQNETSQKISFPIVLPNFIAYFELCWSMFKIIFVRLCFPLLVAILTIQYQRVILVLKSPYYCLEHVCISTTRIMLKLIQKKKWKTLLY